MRRRRIKWVDGTGRDRAPLLPPYVGGWEGDRLPPGTLALTAVPLSPEPRPGGRYTEHELEYLVPAVSLPALPVGTPVVVLPPTRVSERETPTGPVLRPLRTTLLVGGRRYMLRDARLITPTGGGSALPGGEGGAPDVPGDRS